MRQIRADICVEKRELPMPTPTDEVRGLKDFVFFHSLERRSALKTTTLYSDVS